jgi:hypothetical protein
MKKLALWGAIAYVTAALSTTAIACEKPANASALYSENDAYLVTLQLSADPVKVANPFTVNLKICRKDGKEFMGSVKADAQMPMHGHGMNYQPSLTQTGANSFMAEGFVLHMPGKWQFDIQMKEASQTAVMKIDYLLK